MTDKTFRVTFFSFIKMGKYYFTYFIISLLWTKRLLSRGQGIKSCTVCVFMVSFCMLFFFPDSFISQLIIIVLPYYRRLSPCKYGVFKDLKLLLISENCNDNLLFLLQIKKMLWRTNHTIFLEHTESLSTFCCYISNRFH